jgi:ubiquinone/menaquinone biosynthesis C-methylase UbiE
MKKAKGITELFTDLASDYERSMDRELKQFWGTSYGEFVSWLVAQLPLRNDAIVLDLATGTAAIPRVLAHAEETPKTIIGLDITPAMLFEGKQAGEREGTASSIDLVRASGVTLPFSTDSVDLIICAFGLHHMSGPDMLGEASRVFRSGGKVFLVTAGVPGFWRSFLGGALLELLFFLYGLAGGRARVKAEKEALQNTYTENEWRENLSSSGLCEIDIATRRAHRPWLPNGLVIRATSR